VYHHAGEMMIIIFSFFLAGGVYKDTVLRKAILYMPEGEAKRRLYLEAFGEELKPEVSLYSDEDYWPSSSEERFDPADLPC